MRARHGLLLSGFLFAAALFGPRPAEAIVVERIVAVVGDRPILMSELRTRARPFLIQIQQKVRSGAEQAAAESQVFKDMLQKMIDEELEAQAAEKASITVTPDEVDSALRNIAASQNITTAELFRAARQSAGLTEQEYRDEMRRQILEGKMLQLRVKGRVRITEEDLKTMYERTLREEKRRREYHPAWVVLQVTPGSSPEAVEERKRLAQEIAARAQRGEDFGELARSYSDDTATRDSGGDLGIRAPQGSPQAVPQGQRQVLAPEFEAAVMALEPGQISAPIQVNRAIVVLKLLSRQPSRYTSYDAAKGEMMQILQTEILGKAKRKWLDEMKKRTHLDVRL
jgi:peptidyl-prolyl cis-trans isomerase SurA